MATPKKLKNRVHHVVHNTNYHYIMLAGCYFAHVPYYIVGVCYVFIAVHHKE